MRLKIGIRAKLLGVVAVTLAVAFVVCGVVASRYFFDILKTQAVDDEVHKLRQTARQLHYIQEEIGDLARAIAVDENIQGLIARDYTGDAFGMLVRQQTIAESLSRHLSMKSHFYSAYVILEDGTVFSSNRTQGEFDFSQEQWYTGYRSSGRGDGFTGAHRIYVTQKSQTLEVISYVMSFRDLYSGQKVLGDVIINVDFAEITRSARVDTSVLTGYALLGHNGDVIVREGDLAFDYVALPRDTDGQLVNERGNILLTDSGLLDGWLLVSEVSDRLLMEQLRYVSVFFVAMYCAVIVALACILAPVLLGIVRPLRQLTAVSAQVGKGDFSGRVDIHTGDELEELGAGFNAMVKDLDSYVRKTVDYEKTVREMELNRLMLQINPHFIYNTLNSIVYMAEEADNHDVAHFSRVFISLLQDTLSAGRDDYFTTLEQEIKNINNYLVLQSYRYPDRFEQRIDADPETLPCRIPSVLLQPLVENALFHGLLPKAERGVITVAARRDGERLVIAVTDDGVGIPPEKIRQLLGVDTPISGMMRTIGVANVRQRILHTYGDGYGLQIESDWRTGTIITITLPFEPQEALS